MGKLKKGIAVGGGMVLGLVTLRALRNRGSDDEAIEAVEEEIENAEDELETAAEHATAAVEHASVAVKKAIEARNEKTE